MVGVPAFMKIVPQKQQFAFSVRLVVFSGMILFCFSKVSVKRPHLHKDNNCLGKLAPVQLLPTMITEGLVFTLHRLFAARADWVGKHFGAAGIITDCRNGHGVSVA